jgi:membrane associated rhomboid family serine protease
VLEQNDKISLNNFYFPLAFLLVMWLVKIIEVSLGIRLVTLGILPRSLEGLSGIFFSPFIHGDWKHLINNSLPIGILGVALFYFYRPIALKIFLLIFFIGNIWLWALGREAWHIGASGIVYGLVSFIFLSGILRKHIPLMVLSLLVAFLYGSLVWGVLPIDYKVSFEGHLTGSIAGVVLAIIYRDKGPQKKKYLWEYEEDTEDDENAYWKLPTDINEQEKPLNITYHFKEKDQGTNS